MSSKKRKKTPLITPQGTAFLRCGSGGYAGADVDDESVEESETANAAESAPYQVSANDGRR